VGGGAVMTQWQLDILMIINFAGGMLVGILTMRRCRGGFIDLKDNVAKLEKELEKERQRTAVMKSQAESYYEMLMRKREGGIGHAEKDH
jgi:hypothetical protein